MSQKNKRHILFIGDLRPVFNYGAVATSDVLLARIQERLSDDDELRVVDHRSFFHQTPREGFPEWVYPRYPKDPVKLRRLICRQKVRARIRQLKNLLNKSAKDDTDPLPARWKDSPGFQSRVLNGGGYAYEKGLIEWADEVIINSEGNIVNGIEASGKYRRGARYIFAMAYLAQVSFNKPTSIINFTVDPKNPDAEEIIREVFPLLERVIPREPLSIPELRRIGVDRDLNWCPDILFSYDEDKKLKLSAPKVETELPLPESNYICLGDSSGLKSLSGIAKWDLEEVLGKIIKTIRNELKKEVVFVDGFNQEHPSINRLVRNLKVPRVSLLNCPYQSLIRVLGNADLFISGRWHASIMASLGGTPFLLWGSDSHKTRALHVIFDSPYRFYDIDSLPIHLDDLMNDVRSILLAGDSLREQICRKSAELGEHSLGMLDFLESSQL